MLLTMVILAVFLVLFTYTCSAPSSWLEGHLWGSNTFSLTQEHPFQPLWQWTIIDARCWHNTTFTTITSNNHLQPRKQVWTKPLSTAIVIMSTAGDVNVPSALEKESVIDLISNEGKANNFVAKLQSRNFLIFSPPGANSTHTGTHNNTATTKTKLKVEKKAVKEKKAQADKEKKLAVAACKLKAQAKKCKKAIALTNACAQKAAAKAEALRIQLASAKAATETMRTPTGVRGAHVPKKSKGVEGEVALLTPINLTTILSP
jgi:hypothetical protein